jgi:8-oxo-dGTP pyrophosphatase MutT (NUDIX family)
MDLPRIRALIVVEGRLLLFKRTRPDHPTPYYVTPGGGMEESDKSEQGALLRELKEELGVESGNIGKKVFELIDEKGKTQIVYECTIGRIQIDKRTGAEFNNPKKGTYEIVWIPVDELDRLDIRPTKLKEFIARRYVATQRPRPLH